LEFNSFIGASYLQDLSVCDELIDYFETHPEHIVVGRAGKLVDERYKKSKDLSFSRVDSKSAEKYYALLDNSINLYKKKYEYADVGVCHWGITESPNIQRYEPGEGFYGWHNERGSSINPVCYRHLVFMTYLNDVTDGGETEFFYQQVKIQPKKGLTLIWPADWTHTHRGITSLSQTKYIVTGWYSLFT